MLETIMARAERVLCDAGLHSPHPRVLVAVSGGCDSVALLHVLMELGRPIAVAHVDHGTRGGESRADAAFVASLAGEFALPCHVCRHDVPAEAHAAGVSVEQQGRAVRYAFLTATARDQGYAAIATGHHADDQAETVLLRLIRGAGPEGLGGIPVVRDLGGIPLVRPLLGCRRDELAACAETEGWVHRTDLSNADVSVPRNRVRHELLPLLRGAYNPAVVEALGRLAAQHQVQEAFMAPQVDCAHAACVGQQGIDRAAFAALHTALRHRVIARCLQEHGVEHPCARVAGLAAFVVESPTGRYADAGGGLRLYAGRTHVALVQARGQTSDAPPHPLPAPGELAALGYHFRCEWLDQAPSQPAAHCGPEYQVFDADRLVGGLVVRTRRAGDRFTPLGMTGTQKLKDYFIGRGLPAPQRDAVPLILDGAGIVWVVGHGPAARVRVDEQTSRCLAVHAAPVEASHAAQ
jgi:tRNA(Ile)-lysidine synthase